MHKDTDIRALIQADAMLQREITQALLAVADTLATGTDRRIVRILTRILDTSWDEHVSLQDEVIFPILASRHGAVVQESIKARQSEHASLSQRHSEIGRQLAELLAQDAVLADRLEGLLRGTHAQRLAHLERDAELDGWLPQSFTETECLLCGRWSDARPHLRFPFNLLRQFGRAQNGNLLH